jgi:hypothetical protein
MKKFNKKAASFEIYNWFLLIMAIVLLSVALYSYYVKISSIGQDSLGSHANNIFNLISHKERDLMILEGNLNVVAPLSIFDVGKNGIYNTSSIYYFNVPIFKRDSIPIILNQKSFDNYFKEVFTDKLNDELKGKLNFSYDYNSIFIENDTIYGYSTNSHTLSKSILVPDASVDGILGWFAPKIDYSHGYSMINFRPNFKYNFQSFYTDNYYKVLNKINEIVYIECQNEENKKNCINIKTREFNDGNSEFEIFGRDRCIVNYNNLIEHLPSYSDFYSISDELLIYYEFASKIKECLNSGLEVICEIKIDVFLKTESEFTLSNIILNDDNNINISYFDKITGRLLLSEQIPNTVFFNSNTPPTKIRNSELKLKTTELLAFDKKIAFKLDSDSSYNYDNVLYIHKIGGMVSLINKAKFDSLKDENEDIKVMHNTDFNNDLHYLCVIDKNVKLPAKSGASFHLINPSYNFVLYTGERDPLGALENRYIYG